MNASSPNPAPTSALSPEIGRDSNPGQPTNASRRRFLCDLSLAGAATLLPPFPTAYAWSRFGQATSLPGQSQAPDFSIEIGEIEWELSPKKRVRTTAYNGQIPGKLLRLTEGKPVTIEIANKLDRPEIVHWHGQWIPPEVDGSMEEGSPMIAAGSSTRVTFTPRPSGLHWYHTHVTAHRDLKRA